LKKISKLLRFFLVLIFPSFSYSSWKKPDSDKASNDFLVRLVACSNDFMEIQSNNFLYDYINTLDYQSCLEVGSGVGSRIIPLAIENPKKKFTGVDINSSAVQLGNDYLKNNKINNMVLYSANLVQIETQEYSSDVVVTWATLIYISPREIKRASANLSKLTKNYLVIVEMLIENNDSIYKKLRIQLKGFPNWSYNYEKLFKKKGFLLIKKDPIPQNIWAPGGGGAHILIFKKENSK
jgi:SAM-dependent methyltransferase